MNYQGISVICQGDTTTTGGRVLEGVLGNRYTCDGIPVALKGHKVSCPACGKIGVIAEGEANLSFYGVPTALDGHRVACGCPAGSHRLVASSQPLSVTPSISPSSMLMNSGPAAEPAQYAQSVKKQTAEPEQHAQAAKKERQKREITLTIGVFFDGTGNNADNTAASLDACSGEHFGMNNADAQSAYFQCVQLKSGHSGFAAGSHLGYYTNVHWLNTLYSTNLPVDSEQGQNAIYIEGIGTESGEGDSAYGMGTGRGNSGVVSKTDKAVRALVAAIKAGLGSVEFSGTPGGKTRFLGIFDTVAGIGTPVNGFNPHSADTGEVNIVLRPGVAEKVFHITAQHECRFNFALNSVKPAWPELALPGAHSDIGGGYNPDEYEAYFITRPQFETVPFSTSDTKTRVYQQACEQLSAMDTWPAIGPLLQVLEINIDTWHDERMPADRYGMPQKRSGAAAVIERPTRNDWSRVVLRVMLDAAQDAGVLFDPIRNTNTELRLSSELNNLCEKAIVMGRAVRNGASAPGFTSQEVEMLAEKYIHCSANWNSVVRDGEGMIAGAVKPAKLVTFTNRPDESWQRTVYNMDGNKI
ncbi:TPA: PAAR domain-containing protein [Serratia fonticola]